MQGKQFIGHDKSRTLQTIIKTLGDIGYQVQYSVLNALDYGLPQKRERVIIAGHINPIIFSFPTPVRPFKPLSIILEKKVDTKHYASNYIISKRKAKHKSTYPLSIWHENKAGNAVPVNWVKAVILKLLPHIVTSMDKCSVISENKGAYAAR